MNQKHVGVTLAENRKNTELNLDSQPKRNVLEIEAMAESFGAVDISNVGQGSEGNLKGCTIKKKKMDPTTRNQERWNC